MTLLSRWHADESIERPGDARYTSRAMKLQVVLLNFRTADLTLKALASVYRATLGIPSVRIDVVDNHSEDGSAEKLAFGIRDARYFPDRVRMLVSPRNGGFGAGNNFAIRAALASSDPPEFIYILNSDAFPEEDAVEALLDFLEAHPQVGIAGSYIYGVDGKPHETAFRFPSILSELEAGAGFGPLSRALREHTVPILPPPRTTQRVDWLAGASMMVRAEVLQNIGLFDEEFFLYFEETDLSRRAALAGYATWYVIESRVAHVGSASTGMKTWRRMPSYWFDSRAHYFEKNHGRAYKGTADVAFSLAFATHRLRALVQKKRDNHPAQFLRDFVRHPWQRNSKEK